MSAVQAAAALLIAFVCAVSAVDMKSTTARRIRNGEPLLGMLSLRHRGQPSVTPSVLYLAVAGTRTGSLDIVRIPSGMPVFEKRFDGEPRNQRTLADVYAAKNSMVESAITMLQGDASWPENPVAGPEQLRPAALDFQLSFELPANTRPGYPREIKHLLRTLQNNPLFWPQCAMASSHFQRHSVYDRLLLAREFRRIQPQAIRLSELTDPELSNRLLSRIFSRARGHGDTGGSVDIEVLNAAGAVGLALKATRIIRLQGFDVKHFGNARDEKNSRFLDHVGNPAGAEAVAAALGCRDAEVLTSLEANPRAAISVLLGKDYANCTELAPHARSN